MGKHNNLNFGIATLAAVLLTFSAELTKPALANGLGENRAWQFRTSADRANLAGVADVVEKKKGGYYDGFTTVVNTTNVTNIGTQVNCNNIADATGNIADNGQSGNAPVQTADGSVASDASGNSSSGNIDGEDGSSSVDTSQTNDGSVDAGVSDSDVLSSTGDVQAGSTHNALNNDQFNSGNQNATIADSTACDMAESTFSGAVDALVEGDSLNGPLN